MLQSSLRLLFVLESATVVLFVLQSATVVPTTVVCVAVSYGGSYD